MADKKESALERVRRDIYEQLLAQREFESLNERHLHSTLTRMSLQLNPTKEDKEATKNIETALKATKRKLEELNRRLGKAQELWGEIK